MAKVQKRSILTKHTDFIPIRKTVHGKHLQVSIANTAEEIDRACRLRYEIFKVELGHGSSPNPGSQSAIDEDQYDEYCDHLIVVDETSSEIVGTYRLLPLDRVRDTIGLYSENEFNLENLYKSNLAIVEVGRACIDAAYRDGSIINLLWTGLASYLEQFHYEYLTGCASLEKEADAVMANKIYQYCSQRHSLAPENLRVYPLEKNRVDGFDKNYHPSDAKDLKRELPALIRAYLTIGCMIGGEPAFDPDFGVIDFFIMFERKSMAKRTQRFFS